LLKQNKTTMELQPTYKIVGSYKAGDYEEIDIAHGEENKEYLVSQYRLAYGTNWHIAAYRIDE